MGSQEPLKFLNVEIQGTGDVSQTERGIMGPYALSLKSPAIWELESQLLRHEVPSNGQLAEGTIHRLLGGSPVPPFPAHPSCTSLPPQPGGARPVQGRWEAGPAPTAACFQPPGRQAWACLLVRQVSLPLL